jgi:hypothetical protein
VLLRQLLSHHILAARLQASLITAIAFCHCLLCRLRAHPSAPSHRATQIPHSPLPLQIPTMSDLAGRKVFKVRSAWPRGALPDANGPQGLQPGVHCRRALQCNQGAGPGRIRHCLVGLDWAAWRNTTLIVCLQCGHQQPDRRRRRHQEGHQIKLLQHFRGTYRSTRRQCHVLTVARAQERKTTPRDDCIPLPARARY